MTDFAAIDFETANCERCSVCSVGVVIVRDGQIVDKYYSLIKPEPEYYNYWCSQVHGLTAADTEDAPIFPKVWAEIEPLIERLPLVAHNKAFDDSCLKAVFRVYQMDYPDYEFHCTLKQSKKIWKEGSHNLDVIAARCGYDLSNHHHALADAEACAAIAMKMLKVRQTSSHFRSKQSKSRLISLQSIYFIYLQGNKRCFMGNIIGRKEEIRELNDLYNSNKAQMVAVYGRRRVGKTFLVDEALKGRITFRHAGLSPNNEGSGKKNLLKDQLKHFYHSLLMHGMKKSKQPTSWLDAFFMLEQHLSDIDDGSRQVVFLDELPWLDTPRSGFLTAFEAFWNTWGCHRDNLMVVVCGSANSWILDNLINDTGGLYGRTTYEIKLSPFTLKETEDFLKSKEIKMSRYDIAQCNMILGGIPYYLGYLTKNNSLAQNIDQLFFSQKPKLHNEFDRLFVSVFRNPEVMKKIIRLLATRHSGFTRKEIISNLDFVDSGDITDFLNALIASDFIVRYTPFGKSSRDDHYRLIDPFCLFYIKYVSGKNVIDTNFWTNNQMSQSVVSWRGVAFEDLCIRHMSQIKNALGISGVITSQSSWIVPGNENEAGMQVDLLINRNDNIVNMCEMKFYNDDFTVNGDYFKKIASRANKLHEELPKKYAVHSTLITTYGLTYNEYSGAFQQVITLEELFS